MTGLFEEKTTSRIFLKQFQSIVNLQNKDTLDIGAGTGRLSSILAPFVRTITAMDLSLPMIQSARNALKKSKPENWQLAVGDNAYLPIKDKSFDLVVSGWSFCYLAVWGGEQWQTCLQLGLSSIKRVLRESGCIILLETMGTGFESPNPPAHLNAYFNYLTECGLCINGCAPITDSNLWLKQRSWQTSFLGMSWLRKLQRIIGLFCLNAPGFGGY